MSLVFSNQLGLINRAILGFVFLITGILVNFFTLGFGLKILALHRGIALRRNHLFPYILSAILFLIIGLGILNLFLFLFLLSVGHLKVMIFLVVSIYFSVSYICQLFYDFLLRTHQYKQLNVFLALQTFFSVSLFFFLIHFLRISVFVSIFISLTLSFLLPTMWIIIQNRALKSSLISIIGTKQDTSFVNRERKDFVVSVIKSFLLVIGDKLDRIMVLLILPLEVFAKILVAQSFLFFLKPINDLILNHDIRFNDPLKSAARYRWIVIFSIISILFLPILYQKIVFYTLGDGWLLPFHVFLLLFGFEIIKQTLFNRYIRTMFF